MALLLLVSANIAAAQDSSGDDFLDDSSSGDAEDQLVIVPHGESFEEGPAIENVIEGVGTIIYSTVPIYTSADKKSKVVRYAIPGEKVTIIASNDDWYCVHMYSGKEGFVEKKNVKAMKVFYDESVTSNYMDKRLNVEILDLLKNFNVVLANSSYAQKFQIIPRLTMTNSFKRSNMITVMLEYSAVDINGNMVPSMKDNDLSGVMKDFIELLFMKMLPAKATTYQITIRKPVFSSSGQVMHTQGEYADLKLELSDVHVKDLKRKRGKVLESASCTVPLDKLFRTFPN